MEKMEKPLKLKPTASFEYELFDGDPDHLRTVVATPTQTAPWINPSELKFKHRIGRGPFGDVWLATHHQSADDFDEYHEVAVKMLHPLKEDLGQRFVENFEALFLRMRELQGVCWLHGISKINGSIGIAMKIYEESVADQIARSKGGKLKLPDVLRYGIDLAKGILQLHSLGLLLLNVKPSNFLLDEHDQLVVGDFGIPYLLLGIPLLNSDTALRLGTPSYMAPEQWEPEARGPLCLETDSWGFGCSILEMLTGTQPWFGKSCQEIYKAVVIKQQKPSIPGGLPPAVENVISGCFEYDARNRPIMDDILAAFESSHNAVQGDEGWICLESNKAVPQKSPIDGYTSWYRSKDDLQVNDMVRSRTPLNVRKPETTAIPKGTIVGKDADKTGFVLVKISGVHNPLKVQESTLERVTLGFAVGDWVRLKDENFNHSRVGILHTIKRNGRVTVGFAGREILWMGDISKLEVVEPYYQGQFVRVKADISAPRFDWPHKGTLWATGRISRVLPNGCLVVIFPGRFTFNDESKYFLADPAQVEVVTFDTCPGLVEKYQHVEDFHWAIRPLTIALGAFTAMKLGISTGQAVSSKLNKTLKSDDNKTGSKTDWLPQSVANVIFKDGLASTTVR
ncbi:E3 ubiquitin-protein ligase KEG [Linum perenne]